MKTKLLLLSLTMLSAGVLCAAESPRVGTTAPAFTVPDAHGKMESLSQYKGKYVVLEWFNPDCPFVRKHYFSHNMQTLQKEFTAKGVIWLTIDSSAPGEQGNLSPADARQQMSDWKMDPTAFLLDPNGKVGHTYGATNTPHMFVINPEGKVIYEGAIDSKPSTDQSDIATATNYVKVALTDALAGKPIATTTTKAYGCSVKYSD
ncbi:MAG TPA: thioredoxin family protein [Chthoniobacterales bacterium]|jgi:peroxiredoxin|nr:thioredoxin family protein [Chthoniobacterales bacterium]